MNSTSWLSALVQRPYALYGVTIFLSAFLLFQIQPIAGKFLLPWFGGSAAVWTVSLLFFSSVLFFGYLYAYLLSLRPVRVQVRVHIGAIALGMCVVLVTLFTTRSLHVPLEWFSGDDPSFAVLAALAISIGVPYFLLSTTGPLLQQWYGLSYGQEPYKLYAVSNAGSFVALVSYPFIVEPQFTLTMQQILWGVFFILFGLLCAAISTVYGRIDQGTPLSRPIIVSWSQRLSWIALSILPTFMLVATTTHLTNLIAPIPFLWLLLLAIYLATFISAFSGRNVRYAAGGLLVAASTAGYCLGAGPQDILMVVLADSVLLAFVGLYCNQELYRLRPGAQEPAQFYLYVSFGGMIGALLASIVAPLIFNDYWEFPMGLAISAVLAAYGLLASFKLRSQIILAGTITALLIIGVTSYFYVQKKATPSVYEGRNFYGAVRVSDKEIVRTLMSGSTLHGLQPFEESLKYMPIAYYSPDSGVGRAMMHSRIARVDEPLSVHVIGLGAGMIAAYCGPGDRFVFSEIDPKIIMVAKEHFTYLAHCPSIEILQGDGRKLLSTDQSKYDVIVVDAFSDDSIPAHLLTSEAVKIYVDHLRNPESVLAIHISNRFLDLFPQVVALAKEQGLAILYVQSQPSANLPVAGANWVLLSKDSKVFDGEIFKDAGSTYSVATTTVWTDEYTDIISALRIPLPSWLQ